MIIRPYLSFAGDCQKALDLYGRAFQTEPLQVLRWKDLPTETGAARSMEQQEQVVQATMQLGETMLRLSDGKEQLHGREAGPVSLAVECTAAEARRAFAVLSADGEIIMPLAETFYSPCAGVVIDPFGVLWNLAAQKD